MEAVGLNEDVEEFEKEHDVYDFSRIMGKDTFDFEKLRMILQGEDLRGNMSSA